MDMHHPLQPHQGSGAQQIPRRGSKKARPQSHPDSPHQQNQQLANQQAAAAFPSPHSLTHGLPLQHHSPYPQPSSNSQGSSDVYYSGSSYGTPASGQYSASEDPSMMAAAHMQQRQPYPVYHTPQSNSPASVTSSQGHHQDAARIYSQPPQLHNGMYYQQHQVPYSQPSYPPPQHQPMPQQHQPIQQAHQTMVTSQPPMPHSQAPIPIQHSQHAGQHQGMTNSPRPQTKIEPGLPQQRPMDANVGIQRTPTAATNSHPNTPASAGPNGLVPHGSAGGAGNGANPNAAPGPIPATTPLVVRQDSSGVQWIAFEYSRDRVKMEYTIRCDVESVNLNVLDEEFKKENCVYPRACGPKEEYKGNRQVYETECNSVGWSLASLNQCLRGKRGLIQRAVDSWRNSNSDTKLRSRRVRRQNKQNVRNKNPGPHTNHMAGPRDVGSVQPPNGIPPQMHHQQRPPPNMGMTNTERMHHHNTHPDTVNPEDSLGMYRPW